jgi:ankyrin repeat protein
MSHLGIYKSEETILLTEVSAAVKENRIDEAIYIATTRSIGYVHTHDHTGEVQRIPSKDPKKDLEFLSTEVAIPGGITALIRAAQYNNLNCIKKLIILGVQVDYETSGGLTALGEACKIGSIEIASYLIRHGADVNYKNIFHETPLIQAVRVPDSSDFIRWMLENTKAQPTSEAMLEAGLQAEHQSIFLMLDHGAKIDMVGVDGNTLLTHACERGALGTAMVCIDRNAKIDFETPTGHTALTQAAFFGHSDIVRMLLKKGAKIDYETQKSYTALNQCCINGQCEVARILLERGADPNRNNIFGHLPLTLAARHGHVEMISVLIARKAKLNMESRTGGRIALVEACRFNHPEVVRKLILFNDTSVNIETRSEMAMHLTPLVAIAFFNSIDCIEPIMKSLNWTTGNRNGVELYKETCEMISPIGACIMKGHIEMTKAILKYMHLKCADDNLLKERNARRLFCNALDEYIAKAFEKSSLISKHETKKKEQAEGVYDALMNAKEMEEKIIVTLRKKHFDQIKLEELREEWERLGPSKQKSKLGDSILHEIELIDAELMVELKFGAFAVSQGLHVK